MFIPTEGIGAAVAKILSECGLKPSRMEFYEDRAVVEFSSSSSPSRHEKPERDAKPDKACGKSAYPVGPWVKSGKRGNRRLWKCGETEATTQELARAYGVTPGCMEYRLRSEGYAETRRRRSRFERKNKRGRMSLSDK